MTADKKRKQLTRLYAEQRGCTYTTAVRRARTKRCEDCKQVKDDAVIRLDPYEQDVNNRDIAVLLCNSCSHERAMEI